MHFCDKCDNMYYISISSENENKMSYYCRNCGNEDDNISNSNVRVYRFEAWTAMQPEMADFDHWDQAIKTWIKAPHVITAIMF